MLLISVSWFENWKSGNQFFRLSSEYNWHCVFCCVSTANVCHKPSFLNISGWLMRNPIVENFTWAHLVHITNTTLGSLYCIIYFPVCHSQMKKYVWKWLNERPSCIVTSQDWEKEIELFIYLIILFALALQFHGWSPLHPLAFFTEQVLVQNGSPWC